MKNRVKLVNTTQQPKSYKNSIKVVNLSGYQSPEIIEDDRKDWVLYKAGDDGQDYFESLIEKLCTPPSVTTSLTLNSQSSSILAPV